MGQSNGACRNLHDAAHLPNDVVVLPWNCRATAVEILLKSPIQHPLPFPRDVIGLGDEKLEGAALLDRFSQLCRALVLDVIGSARIASMAASD
jgi:hypothetical protein